MPESIQPVSTPTPQAPSASTNASTARFVLPAKGFALADLFERVPDACVKCEAAVANPDDHALLVVQTDEDEREVDAALRSESDIATVEYFGGCVDSWRYRVTWTGHPRQLIQQLVAADVSIVSVQGRGGEWRLHLLAPDREGVARAHDVMENFDCGADCRSISTVNSERSDCLELTTEQREALVVAFKQGYYNVPRDATANDIADELGISHQALSERFRRAYHQLVKTEFALDEEKHP